MRERGQITIFVVFAVVLFAGVLGFFIFGSFNNEPKDVGVYKNYMTECISGKTEYVLKEFGENSVGNFGNYSVFFEGGVIIMPKETDFKKNLSDLLLNEIDLCLGSFKEVNSDYNLEKNSGESVFVFIEDDSVRFEVNYPVTLITDEGSYTVEDLGEFVVDVRLNEILLTIKKILDEHMDHPDALCATCIAEFAEENNLYIDIEYLSDNELLFIVSDEQNYIEGSFYEFYFIIKTEDE